MALSMIATAYGPPWDAMNGSGVTATGVKLAGAADPAAAGPYLVAVDPSVIPLGTKLHACPNPFGDCGLTFTAADTGGAIKGNRLDFLDMRGRSFQDAWGRRPTTVTVAGPGSSASSSTAAGSSAPSSSPSSSSVPGPTSPLWARLTLTGALLGLGVMFLSKGARRATGPK